MAKTPESHALRRRYEAALKLAEDWLEAEGRSQSWLAKQIGVERSVFSRFMNREEQIYKPDPSRPRMMEVLEGIERVCQSRPRDIFLSHRSADKDFVRRLATDIESHQHGDRSLLTWVDEAEIRPGQSIPGVINQGVETSKFIGIVMTPQYFQKGSGWTDAEWHAALHSDPDNRRARLLPLLVEDCPYIPALLRHLLMIDFRGTKYGDGLSQLLRVLRDEPLPRPVTYRGQLIESGGHVDRATLIAERAVPEADPDAVTERAYCNLLPIETLPRYVYLAPIARHLRRNKGKAESLPTKAKLREVIRESQVDAGQSSPRIPAFRVDEGNIVTFHDLEDPDALLAPVIESDEVEVFETKDFLANDLDRLVIISLINMAIVRHLMGRGLSVDDTKFNRFYFPPSEGKPTVFEWIPVKRKAKRTVTKPYLKSGGQDGWMHHACYIKVTYLASRLYIQLTPTRLLTDDGKKVRGGPTVGRIVSRWLGQERNLHVLYNVRFWTSVLRRGPGPISIRAGDQWLEVATVPAFIQQPYGIRDDQRDLMGLLDEEAPLIAQIEDEVDVLESEADEENDIDDEDIANGVVVDPASEQGEEQ